MFTYWVSTKGQYLSWISDLTSRHRPLVCSFILMYARRFFQSGGKWSQVKSSDIKWNVVKWTVVKWRSSEAKWSQVRWGQAWSMTNWCQVKPSEVRWSQVKSGEVSTFATGGHFQTTSVLCIIDDSCHLCLSTLGHPHKQRQSQCRFSQLLWS